MLMKKIMFVLIAVTLNIGVLSLWLLVPPRDDTAVAHNQESRIDYPSIWKDTPKETLVDSWGYQNRTCASYVAYKVWKTYGVSVANWGDGASWLSVARINGYTVDNVPSKNAVIVYLWPPTHVQWIERINKDGTVHISQYDATNGKYSEQDFDASDTTLFPNGLNFIHFN